MTPRSITGRVARVGALAAALAATLTATLSVGLAWRGAIAREDTRLQAAAHTLAQELGAAPDDDTARLGTDDENHEVLAEGIRLSLWRGERHLGGERALGHVTRTGCESVTTGGAHVRRCVVAVQGGMRVMAVRSLATIDAATRASALTSLVAVAVTAVFALVVSRRVAMASLAPLARLVDAVRAVDADVPDATKLPVGEGFVETDALRDALAVLLVEHAHSLATARRFAADAAHELRTPLGVLQGELELLTEVFGPDVGASLTRVRATVTGLGALAERLLVLAAPLDVAMVTRDAVAPADVVRDAIVALSATQRGRVLLELDDDATVAGDALLLRAMLDNVLDNALTHAPEGMVTVRVVTRGAHVEVTVRDEGPGIAPTERARVFEAFYRAPQTRASGRRGHGVGLALVAHIARAHGGHAVFEDVSLGTSLRIVLPRWSATPMPDTVPPLESPPGRC